MRGVGGGGGGRTVSNNFLALHKGWRAEAGNRTYVVPALPSPASQVTCSLPTGSTSSLLLHVYRHHRDYQGRGAQDGHLDFHTVLSSFMLLHVHPNYEA